MSTISRIFISISMVGVLGAGCKMPVLGPTEASFSASSSVPVVSSPAITVTSFDWSRPHTPVTASNGVQVKSCGGDAPIACAYRDGQPVGQMEFLTYDTASDEKPLSLSARVQDYYKNISSDRRETCPRGYEVETESPQEVIVAGKAGLRAQLVVKNSSGKLVEKYVVSMMESNKKLYVFTVSGYEKGSCVSEEVGYTTIRNLDQGVLEVFAAIVKTSLL